MAGGEGARAKKASRRKAGNGKNGGDLGFEDTLWQTAEKLKGNVDAAEYKHVVLGLIFLKYINDAFSEKYEALKADPRSNPDESDEYL